MHEILRLNAVGFERTAQTAEVPQESLRLSLVDKETGPGQRA